MFQPENPENPLDESFLDESSLPIEDLLAYSRFVAGYPNIPPNPPPRPQISVSGIGVEAVEEENKAVYRILPGIKKTEVPLNFPRKVLEEYMDR